MKIYLGSVCQTKKLFYKMKLARLSIIVQLNPTIPAEDTLRPSPRCHHQVELRYDTHDLLCPLNSP